MSQKQKISPEDRRFFTLLAEATFSNPFGDRRVQIDLEIIGNVEGSLTKRERFDRLRAIVAKRLGHLEEQGLLNLQNCPAEDHEALLASVLFDVYHRHCDEIDQLIADQQLAGEKPCSVPFAKEAIQTLMRRGMNSEQAKRFFAILFQVRRAYYFTERALIGRSACMKELRRHLWNCVFTHDLRWYESYLLGRMEDFSTLFLGETGTGKGTAAVAIGRSGFIPFNERKQQFEESFTHAFISSNLSMFSELLIESELFGHKKGAFTGAVEDHEGLLEQCSPYGAIFLDEIGDVSVPIQIKLLQVLQDRVFTPVGGREPKAFRGRVIAATNQPLDQLRKEGTFRDDFFYRLSSHVITVPPLRQRIQEDPQELPDLVGHLLERMIGDQNPELVDMVIQAIQNSLPEDYPWYGNVRELEQCVRRILLTRKYSPDKNAHLISKGDVLLDQMSQGGLTAQEMLSEYCQLLYTKFGTLAEVARRTQLDRRTVKKHVGELANGVNEESNN